MKYFTKEIAAYMCSSFRHCDLIVDERSADPSDAMFYELYARAFCPYLINRSKINISEISGRAESDVCFAREMRMLRQMLPPAVLSATRDLRLLALGHLSADVYDDVLRFREETEETIRTIKNEYQQILFSQRGSDPTVLHETVLHDTYIFSARWDDGSLTLRVENCGLFFSENENGSGELVLKECRILLKEDELKDCSILYDEFYSLDKGYEWHLLTAGWKDGAFRCFTFSFSGAASFPDRA